MKYSKEFIVSEFDSAKAMKSGSLDCLATPACIAMAENTCLILADKIIEDYKTTVGTFIEFKHLKSSSIGETIRIDAILLDKSHKKLDFEFAIYKEATLIGKGRHNRYIVNPEEFMSNLKNKHNN